jgi:acetyl/propionyl-CoA carboxylase alpha subunit
VAEQLRIAEGAPLSFGDAAPEPRGWAMEARIVAEDPLSNFLPSIGRIERLRYPHGPGVRVDGGIYRGYEIPVYYDSLISKLVCWGSDRDHVRRRMGRALGELVIEGVKHNAAFHRWLVSHPEFAAGRLSTRFIEEHFRPEALAPDQEATEIAILAAALHAREERSRIQLPQPNGRGERSAWKWADRRRGAGARR